MDRLTPIQRIAFDAVVETTKAKEGNRDPCAAHIREIRALVTAELTDALRDLCRHGYLSVRTDVNKNPMFRTTDIKP